MNTEYKKINLDRNGDMVPVDKCSICGKERGSALMIAVDDELYCQKCAGELEARAENEWDSANGK